jgi:hypothetical protein
MKRVTKADGHPLVIIWPKDILLGKPHRAHIHHDIKK